MHVGLDGGDERGAVLRRGRGVDRGIAAWIDHDRLARAIAPDQERCLRETLVEEPLEHAVEFRGYPAGKNHTPTMSLLLVAGVVCAGAVAGGLGSLLGIGGGVFLVPFLNAGLG